MPISVNPILPVIAAQGAASDLVLQPGTVINAQVVKVLTDNLVRIAIASLSIDVLSEVPLQAGQSLQLAVSQTENGIRLAVVDGPQVGSAAGALTPDAALASGAAVDVAPDVEPVLVTRPTTTPLAGLLTPPERLAVAAAVQSAVTRQDSLAPLFANLGISTGSKDLPPKLQQAILQVLAQRTSLDQTLSGGDLKNAFQKSGILFEATLASGSVPAVAGVPDLKAALIVLRQALSSLGAAGVTESPLSPATAAQQPVLPAAPVAGADTSHALPGAAAPPLAPGLLPDGEVPETSLPQTHLALTGNALKSDGSVRIVFAEPTPNARAAMAGGAALHLLQEMLSEIPNDVGRASSSAALPRGGRNEDATFHTNVPPPPFRGALPSVQPVASPSISSDTPLATVAHHLLAETDSAIARQTLLQVASLPDRMDSADVRTDPATPRWSFEIPFATPQGTAVTQFEISRDGKGSESEPTKRIWQARFSLDVEPAGPVHALVSLSRDKTSVRMWAERPATAALLRAGAAQLGQALSKAELQPGEIVIRDGVPPQPAPARAGHFLDRAL